jgi:hypothetical protein
MKYLGRAMGPQFAAMAPGERQDLLFRLTGQALGGDGVRCLEAPEWPPVRQQLRRDLDGRSVYTRPGTARYATAGQPEMEGELIQQAQTQGAPRLPREVAARLLGADAGKVAVRAARTAAWPRDPRSQVSPWPFSRLGCGVRTGGLRGIARPRTPGARRWGTGSCPGPFRR